MRARLRLILLRLLGGIPREDLHELDGRRHAIVVTHHCLGQAALRYRNNDAVQILADVAAALRAGRVGQTGPNGIGAHGRGMVCVWTDDHARAYVVRRLRAYWVVVTAIPMQPSTKAQRRRLREQTATPAEPTPIRRPAAHDLHPFGTPAVGAALERAGVGRRSA